MTQPIAATPVQKMDCHIQDCQKQKKDGYKTKVGLANHMKKWHQVAKDALSPLTATARTLFKNVEDESGASTQGNSKGEVNVVKVVSKGIFMCGICGKNHDNKEDMNKHMGQHGTSAYGYNPTRKGNVEEEEVNDDQANEDFAKDIDNLVIVDKIVDAFVEIAFRAMRPSEAPETTKIEDEYNLLFRQHQKVSDKNVVLTRANENRLEVLKDMEKVREVASSSIKDLQETKKTNQVLEESLKVKDIEIEAMEVIIKNLKKKSEDDAEKAMEQAKNIRAMEEELGVWDDVEEQETSEEEVTELNNQWISDEARRHNTKQFKCEKCNYETNNQTMLAGHMTKHNGYECTKCKKRLKTQGDLNDHVQREHRPDLFNCTKCNKKFTAKNALNQHMNSQHPSNPPVGHSQWAQQKNNSSDYNCTQCDNGFESLGELRAHKNNKHRGQNHNGIVISATPCKFHIQGRCNRQQCRFSHEKQQHQNHRERVPECIRGQQCQFFAWGNCNFFHKGVGVQQARKQQNGLQSTQRKCHFQERCWNQNCKFSHKDFSMETQFQENY